MKKIFSFITLAVLFASFSSCLKENFDEPHTGGRDPEIEVNFTIDSLIKRYNGTPLQIQEDLVISAVITADDKSGNFYQTLVIQDSTAGIALRVDASNMYTNYPIGRRVFIKLKGLWIGAYANLMQLGGYLDEAYEVQPITYTQLDKHILKGVYYVPVVPKAVTISQLNNSYQNQLIELNNVEFSSSDVGKAFADPYNQASLNRTLKDCSGKTIIVRTSGYAKFAKEVTPSGNGKLLAIYTVFNSTPQLVLRDVTDLSMDSVRCGGVVNPTGNGIMGIRSLYSGSNVTLPSGKTIKGIVISDKDNGNTDPKNMVLQDSTGGIVVRFTANHSFAKGDEVSVNLSGLTLSDFNDLVQITNVPTSAATKTGTGTIAPRVATIAQVLANASNWESTLITIQNATITGGTTYTGTSGTTTLNDGTGTMAHYTRTGATGASFANTSLPAGNKSFTGCLGIFNGTSQLSIRSLSDVQ